MLVATASAEVILDTDFTNGSLADGELSGQDGGMWRAGDAGWTVANGTGATSAIWSNSMNWASATPAEADAGFKITYDFKFDSAMVDWTAPAPVQFARVGLANPAEGNGWTSAPVAGFGISQWQHSWTVFNTEMYNGWSGIFVPTAELGVVLGGWADLESDDIRVEWEIIKIAGDSWSIDDFTVTNLDTAASWSFDLAATPTQFDYAGNLHFGQQALGYSDNGGVAGGGDAFYFTQTNTTALAVTTETIPEPATMALLGLGGLLLRRKK